MDCKETREWLHAQLDQELSLNKAVEIDSHLQSCPACEKEFATQRALNAMLTKHAVYHRAPGHLEARIRALLPKTDQKDAQPAQRTRRPFGSWNHLNLGLVVLSVVALSWSLGLYLSQPSYTGRLADEVVSSHVRSLMMNHITDVASSDQHTVKPWFNGKLDFSPAVRDLAEQGFSLAGGRLDYLDHRTVAALVYRYHQHYINVYILPDTKTRPLAVQAFERQGYNMMNWSNEGMIYWVISDMDTRELEHFSELLH